MYKTILAPFYNTRFYRIFSVTLEGFQPTQYDALQHQDIQLTTNNVKTKTMTYKILVSFKLEVAVKNDIPFELFSLLFFFEA